MEGIDESMKGTISGILMKPVKLDKQINLVIGQPGVKPGKFEIEFDQDYGLARKELIVGPNGVNLRVVKTYPFNWYRKLRFRLGLKIKSCNCVIVKQENDN